MKKYIDYKVETWMRAEFNEEVDLQEVIQKIENGLIPPDFGNEYDIFYNQLTETEEFITPEENDNQSTIEVYEGMEFQECVWENGIKETKLKLIDDILLKLSNSLTKNESLILKLVEETLKNKTEQQLKEML